jgi:hypothetical protein
VAKKILGLSLDQMRGAISIDTRWQTIHEDGSPFSGSDNFWLAPISDPSSVKKNSNG